MADSTRELLIRISADASNAIQQLDGIDKGVANVGKSAEKVKDSLARMGHAIAGLYSANQVAQMSDVWTGMASKMALVSPSAESAAAAMAHVFAVAQKTGQSLDAVGTIYQRIAQNALQYNLSQQKVVQITQAVANAVTLSGASAASAQAALMQFGQALASGQLRGEELNSVMEQTPALAEAIARGMGKSVGELKALGEAGALAAKDVLAAIANESARLEEEAGKMGMTFARAGQQIQNALAQFVGGAHGGATGAAAEGLSAIATHMNAVGSAAVVAAGTFAAFKLAGWAGSATLALGQMHPVIRLITVGAGAALAVFEAWGNLKELLPKTAIDNSLAGVKAINDELGKATTQIVALSKEQARVLKVRATAEQGALEKQIMSGQAELLGMVPGSDAFRKKEKELEKLDAAYLALTETIKGYAKAEGEAGTKAYKAALASPDLMTKADTKQAAVDKARQAMVTGLVGTEDPALQAELRDAFLRKEKEINESGSKAGGGRRASVKAEADEGTPAALAYGKAMADLARAEQSAQAAGLELSGTQRTLMELMQSPAWSAMPETWKETALAQFEEARAAEKAADANKRLNAMLEATDSAQIEKARDDMLALAAALEKGVISEEKYLDAVNKRLNTGSAKIEEQKTLVEQLGLSFTSAFEDAIAGGKGFSDVLKGLEKDLLRLIVRLSVTEPLMSGIKGFDWKGLVGSMFSSGGSEAAISAGSSTIYGPPMPSARGNVFDTPSLKQYRNGVYDKPQFFAFASGGVFAEAGPEAIMPLKRTGSGELGVNAAGLSPVININVDNRAAGDGYQATATARNNNGKLDVDILVVKAIQSDMKKNGPITQGFSQMFGMNRSTA